MHKNHLKNMVVMYKIIIEIKKHYIWLDKMSKITIFCKWEKKRTCFLVDKR